MTTCNRVVVVVANPGEQATVEIIPDTLEAMQEAVKGYIEPISLDGPLVAYVNEEALLEGLPWNRWIGPSTPIAGPIVICAEERGHRRSLTDREAAAALRWLDKVCRLMYPDPSSLDDFETKTGQPAITVTAF